MVRREHRPATRAKHLLASVAAGMILAACGPASAPVPVESGDTAPVAEATQAQPTDAPTAVPTQEEAAVLLPTPTAAAVSPTESPTEPAVEPAAVTDWTDVVTVEGDYFVRGNPAAPVRLVDYSDFL